MSTFFSRKGNWIGVALIAWSIFLQFQGGGIINPPAPVPTESLVVLVIEEADDRSKLPREQMLTLGSIKWREVVEQNKGDWEMLDDDADVDHAQSWVQQALKVPHDPPGKVPWVIISNGKTGFSGPLPATENELIDLIKKYGGA